MNVVTVKKLELEPRLLRYDELIPGNYYRCVDNSTVVLAINRDYGNVGRAFNIANGVGTSLYESGARFELIQNSDITIRVEAL